MDNKQVQITINSPVKVLHFSDGVDEVIEEHKTTELNTAPTEDENVNPKTLDWGPWFSHYTMRSGKKVLNAIDYVGEGLASFFGITTPKYQIEIDEYERLQAEKKKMEEESAGWVPKTEPGDIPLVMNEPSKTTQNSI
ncbi:Protein FAM177A1 [Eumeta japonica]|uniref:Protein FAM177A1 n=1 Tax=Eumeta variegata TaxID=151549 RepID=A0A4C1VF11_EUMVA|nr:Protein FAM177A1 [Eumeta japonica]